MLLLVRRGLPVELVGDDENIVQILIELILGCSCAEQRSQTRGVCIRAVSSFDLYRQLG